jgi:hypothetical protein
VTTPELNLASRRGLGPQATWRHQSSPQQGGEVRGHGTRGDSGAHLCREVWFKATVKNRRGDQRGVEWKPIKIPRSNSIYIPKSIRHPSLLTRLRPHSYSKAIDPRNQVRKCSRKINRCQQHNVRDRKQKLTRRTVYILTSILLNTLRACSRNRRMRAI